MRKNSCLALLLAIAFAANSYGQNPIDRLTAMVRSLDEMESFAYTAVHEIKSYDRTMFDTMATAIYRYDEGSLFPIRYVFESPSGNLLFFDGQSVNTVMASEKIILRIDESVNDYVVSNPGLLFSPFYLRTYIDHLLENDRTAIKFGGDTLVSGRKALLYQLTADYVFLLDGSVIRDGDPLPNGMKAENPSKRHLLAIDEKTNLPMFLEETMEDGNYIRVHFTGVGESGQTYESQEAALANSAFLTLGMEEYARIQMAKQREIVGRPATEFSLPSVPGGEIALADMKGSPVLLEFWLTGCGACINAVPSVNKIHATYQPKGLRLYGVEFSDASSEQISKYIQKHQMKYPTLANGKAIAIDYGINGGPCFVLLNKEHQVVYISKNGLDHDELVAEIEKNL